MESVREVFWAVQETYILNIFLPIITGVLIFSSVLIVLFAFGFFRRYTLWKLGGADKRFDHIATRLKTALAVTFAHVRIFKEAYPGIMHFLILWGSILLIGGKIVRLFSYPVGLTVPPQDVFLYASGISEIGGFMIIVGGCLALYRRFIKKPARLDNLPDDALIFGWVFIILITGYMTKGYRIAISDVGSLVDWATWSPVGYFFSYTFPTFMTEAKNEILLWHRAIIHTIPAFVFFVYIYISRSRMQHVWLSPINIFFRSLKPKGALIPIDIETAETYGTGKIEDFTWKQLLDVDACTRCGRCQDNCPAYLSEKPLTPKKLILDLREHLYDVYRIPLIKKPVESRLDMLIEVITEDVIWACTTCRACQEVCPVYIEHIQKIVDMRRNFVLEQANIPETGETVLKCIETRGHSCRGTTSTRVDWTEGLDVKLLSNDSNVDIVYWVGCAAALEDRNIKVAKAMGKIMTAAGLNYAILGDEETCCGEPARRLGNEYLFQLQAMKNIELLKGYNVKKIVAGCPHCFNTIKNEYPQFEGEFEVIHHSQLIAELLKKGSIKLSQTDNGKLTYHDSCYLGRHNDIYDAPREVVRSISQTQLIEMERSRQTGFCCGGGGGRFWMEERIGKRISEMRIEQVIESGADVVASACPYCLQMFEDAIKAKEAEESLKALDIAELVAAAIEKPSE
ncbi:heterodisulfide reductase-related iron-sulfur binding cluster [Chloroflexota bacterium]